MCLDCIETELNFIIFQRFSNHFHNPFKNLRSPPNNSYSLYVSLEIFSFSILIFYCSFLDKNFVTRKSVTKVEISESCIIVILARINWITFIRKLLLSIVSWILRVESTILIYVSKLNSVLSTLVMSMSFQVVAFLSWKCELCILIALNAWVVMSRRVSVPFENSGFSFLFSSPSEVPLSVQIDNNISRGK